MDMTPEELLFFDPRPDLLPTYIALREAILGRWPHTAVRVSRTQISFLSRHIFAMASLPRRRGEGHLVFSLGLPGAKASPRISCQSEPYPGRWTCHIPVGGPEEVDGELLAWTEEAHAFSDAK